MKSWWAYKRSYSGYSSFPRWSWGCGAHRHGTHRHIWSTNTPPAVDGGAVTIVTLWILGRWLCPIQNTRYIHACISITHHQMIYLMKQKIWLEEYLAIWITIFLCQLPNLVSCQILYLYGIINFKQNFQSWSLVIPKNCSKSCWSYSRSFIF